MTANADTTPDPPLLTSATSQEEGVFVNMSHWNDVQSKDPPNDEYSTALQDSDKIHRRSDAKFRKAASASSDGNEDLHDGDDLDSGDTPSVQVVEKSIEMATTSTPVTTSNSNDNEDPTSPSPGYYTTAPYVKVSSLSLLQNLREYRHNRCIMTPLSMLVLLAIVLSSLASLLLTVPQFIIGLFLGPFVRRQFWLVEFLYRWDVARWGHVKLMEMAGKRNSNNNGSNNSNKDPKRGSTAENIPKDPRKKLKYFGLLGHSDTIHQRITVVPGRVYVHPIPQFVDNVCYLIVCLPIIEVADNNNNDNSTNKLPIIGILIDVGEAKRTLAYMECIYEQFYEKQYPRSDYYRNSGEEDGNINTGGMGIEVHAILSTHRHHDHTAGVGEMLSCLEQARCRLSKCVFVSGGNNESLVQGESEKVYNTSPGKVVVVGGAVESVPHCNLFVKNECFIPLPCISIDVNGTKIVNDTNSVVCIECIGVPSHTRGSIVYALRNHPASGKSALTSQGALTANSHLFTGDAIFSGGAGVPFEADLEYGSDNFIKSPNKLKNKNGSSSFRPGAGTLSMERCFIEVLTRATKGIGEEEQNVKLEEMQSRTLLYPGHECEFALLV
jgi:glyoxylase-like metal-dependent hydrolase (beta-lactamase superfamily II)